MKGVRKDRSVINTPPHYYGLSRLRENESNAHVYTQWTHMHRSTHATLEKASYSDR